MTNTFTPVNTESKNAPAITSTGKIRFSLIMSQAMEITTLAITAVTPACMPRSTMETIALSRNAVYPREITDMMISGGKMVPKMDTNAPQTPRRR